MQGDVNRIKQAQFSICLGAFGMDGMGLSLFKYNEMLFVVHHAQNKQFIDFI
jgi:hypothetical protein